MRSSTPGAIPSRESDRREEPPPTRYGVQRALDRLAAEIVACRRCPLGDSRTNAVVYRGGPTPRVVFVGEAPGAAEDRVGVPFVGRSGKILDASLERLGLGAMEVGVLNVLKCRPPANRFDRSAAIACRPFLARQLALLRPPLLVSLGAVALHALDPSAPPVMTAAGTVRPWAGSSLFPLIHPAATLRSRRMKQRWEHDLDALATCLGGTTV